MVGIAEPATSSTEGFSGLTWRPGFVAEAQRYTMGFKVMGLVLGMIWSSNLNYSN